MTVLGSPSEWANLIDSQVPNIIALVIEAWRNLRSPAGNEREDVVTKRLYAWMISCPERATYPFHICYQSVIIEHDVPSELGAELGRMDIAFKPFVPNDDIYFCLECKRLNVRSPQSVRPYFSEYVRFGIFRFVVGQYSGLVPNGGTVANGGILAYVLNGDVDGAMAGVERLFQDHSSLGMDAPAMFRASSIRPTDVRVRETHHRRSFGSGNFVIHHLFMTGDPNAPLLMDEPRATSGRKKKRGPTRKRPARA